MEFVLEPVTILAVLQSLTWLNNSLSQTHWPGKVFTDTNWRDQVRLRLRRLDWQNIQADVRLFVESGFDLNLLNLENLEQLWEK